MNQCATWPIASTRWLLPCAVAVVISPDHIQIKQAAERNGSEMMWLPLLGIVSLLVLCPPPQAAPLQADETSWPRADPNYVITFPRDEGSHPEFCGEWWYITGWLETLDGQPLGF